MNWLSITITSLVAVIAQWCEYSYRHWTLKCLIWSILCIFYHSKKNSQLLSCVGDFFFLKKNLENIDYKRLCLCYSSFGKLTLVVLFFSMSFTLREGGSPADSVVKNLLVNAGDLGSIPGSGRSPGGGNGNPLQYSCLGNPMDRGAWWAMVHRITKSWTWLSD